MKALATIILGCLPLAAVSVWSLVELATAGSRVARPPEAASTEAPAALARECLARAEADGPPADALTKADLFDPQPPQALLAASDESQLKKLAQGWNEAQIKEYFVAQYGDRVLASPPARGLNWLVYIVPPLAILVGVFILYQAFRAWHKPTSADTESVVDPASTPDDEYVARLEEELSKR